MPHEVIMPALGMAQDTGLIVAWHRSAGDAVKADDVLFEVETDKSTMEVSAGADGFVTQIRHGAGSEVPVGDVIAVIGESADTAAKEHVVENPPAAPADDAPAGEGAEVIMPALGMAQDSGVIVTWHKSPGDAVASSDVLFEVETDKATMDVEAGHDGFVAALYADAGEEVPVGAVIAIISLEKPDHPVQRSLTASGPLAKPAAPGPAASPTEQRSETSPSTAESPVAEKIPASKHSITGPILASPKARRLAAEQGLDLTRLAAAGIPMPYHVADLETLRNLPAASAKTGKYTTTQQVFARVPRVGFTAFAEWLAERATRHGVLAAFAAASLRSATGQTQIALRIDQPIQGSTALYADPDRGPLSTVRPEGDDQPDLILRDLTGSRIIGGTFGPGPAPALSVATDGGDFVLTLDYAADQLDADAAITLLDGFAGRLEEPLRHLL